MRRVAFALGGAFLAACSSGDGDGSVRAVESPANPALTPAIIGGSPSPPAEDGAVLLAFEGPAGDTVLACTAALVAENLVVTARHCVSEVELGEVACNEQGGQVSGGEVGQNRPATRFAVHVGSKRPAPGALPAARGQAIVHDGAKTLCGHDIAYLVLDRKIERATLMPMRVAAPPKAGEALVAIGYGITRIEAEPAVRQSRRDVTVREIGPFPGDANDPPVSPRDFLVGESFCQGDSGGPAISQATGALVGIATRVANGNTQPKQPWDLCNESITTPRVYAFYTQVGSFSELTNAAFTAAGAKPWMEGQSDPRLPPIDDGCAIGAPHQNETSAAGWGIALAFGLVAFVRRRVTGTA